MARAKKELTPDEIEARKEKRREYQRVWRINNRERWREYKHRSNEKNPETLEGRLARLSRMAKWRKNNPQKLKIYEETAKRKVRTLDEIEARKKRGRERAQRRRDQHRHEINRRTREMWHRLKLENPQEYKDRRSGWAQKNRGHLAKLQRDYYHKNREKYKKRNLEWAKNNPEKTVEIKRQHEQKLKDQEASAYFFTMLEAMKQLREFAQNHSPTIPTNDNDQ